MLFGSKRDFHTLNNITRELVNNIVEQEIIYYKVDLESTEGNIYGESLNKTYQDGVKLNCVIVRGDQVTTVDDFGVDVTRQASFGFIHDDVRDLETTPEEGDILEWNEDYYEVDTVRENQLFLGRDGKYNLTEYGDKYGASTSIIVDCHLTRGDKVGLKRIR